MLSTFNNIVDKKCDLILIDCEVKGFQNFHAIELIKSYAPNVPIIVTCKNESRHIALRAVVDGADNYYIIRYDYQDMLHKILCISLKMQSPAELARKYAHLQATKNADGETVIVKEDNVIPPSLARQANH